MDMSDNIVTFPGSSPNRRKTTSRTERQKRVPGGPNMQTFLFRSRELILESDEADLVRDVSLNVDKAQTKLMAIRRRLQGVREWSAEQVQLLTAADTKLTAAIIAALLSARGNDET